MPCFSGGNHAKVKISTPVETNHTLLVLKDSYANSFSSFSHAALPQDHYGRSRYYYGNLEELMQAENVDEVLYLYNANTFFSDTSLELALSSESDNAS